MEFITMVKNIFYHPRLFLGALKNLVITLPSFIWYGIHTRYLRIFRPNKQLYRIMNNSSRCLVLVHGRSGNYADFAPMIEHFKTLPEIQNYDMHAVDLGDTTDTTYDQDCEKLNSELEIYNNKTEITLIGLSKGGNIIVRYMQNHVPINRLNVVRLITISSPLRGTEITKLLNPESIENLEMGIDSSTIREINEYYLPLPIYHIVPKYDHLIIPPTNAMLKSTPKDRIYYYEGYHNHISTPYSSDIANAIYNFILEDVN